MLDRQRGAYNLYYVAILSALFAAVAMAAMFSMRYERNLFAEGLDKVTGAVKNSAAPQVLSGAHDSITGADPTAGALRKCVIDGKTVVSNTDCKATNKTSKIIKIVKTEGVVAPKKPVVQEAAQQSNPAIDKMIEKQMQ